MLELRRSLRGSAVSLLVVGGAALAAAPAALATTTVPIAARVKATAVTSGPAKPGSVHSTALRPRNFAQYSQALSAANARYAAWAATHSNSAASVFGPLPPAIPSLTKPGMNASVDGGGNTPPDTTGAIGPSAYVEFVNSFVAVYNRNTLASPPTASVSEDTFTGSSSTCDGQIKWDQAGQRWLYYSLDCGASNTANGYSFGYSKTSSPTPLPSASSAGNWCRYHAATAGLLQDYGKLGNNNGYMIIGANEFNTGTTGAYDGSPIWAWPKPANGAKLSTCPAPPGGFKFMPSSANEFTPEPANAFGATPNGFIVAINPDQAHLRQYTLSSASPPVLTDNGNITVPAFSQPAAIPQPGTTDKIDPSDMRLTQATAAVDPQQKSWAVWTQHTVAGNGAVSVVRWYEIKGGVAQSAPLQTGTISDGTQFAFNGAIAPDGLGNAAAINYDVGNATNKVTVRAQDHLPGTAAGTMANETTLASSTGINQDFSCPSQGSGAATCRWGDYAGASTDPVCQGNVWGTNEWNGPTSAGTATWATQNFRLGVDECPIAAFTDTASGLSVNFNGTGSSDSDGSITTYTWKFGDGVTSTGASATPSHTYAAAGTYNVQLTVKDSAGLTSSVTHPVTVS